MSYFQKNKIVIICEAGKNFILVENPSVLQCLGEAKSLAFYAKRSGADVVKFQTHVFEDEQKKRAESRWDWIKKNEALTPYNEFWKPLKEYCDEIGIKFMTTPMSKMAAEKVNDLVEVWKVGSAGLINIPMIKYLVSIKKPIIISSGMSTLEELDKATAFLKENNADFMITHCVSIYPCPVDKLNLNTISFLRERYNVPVGFSDHSTSTEVPSMTVDLGVQLIEKHMTLDKLAYGKDHHFSLSPKEFKEMVKLIRTAEIKKYAFGKKEKVLYPEEKALWKTFRC